jgi:hypothetical protein
MDGIAIAFQSTQNVIAGNYIGTNANGLTSVRNGLSGVVLSTQTSNNTLGTKTNSPANSSAGNLISGNGQYGVQLDSQTGRNNVSGNRIGTDVSGNQAIPNVSGGVRLTSRSFENLIGGLLSHQQNKISGNKGYGVLIEQGAFVNGDRTVILSGGDNQSVGAAALRIIEDDLFWHNPVNGNDVDNDGAVTPLDVLAIVNLLNLDFPTNLSLQTPFNPPLYIDTDYDAFLSPLDVLIVVNFLNGSGSGEGEGEGEDTAFDLSHEPMSNYGYWPEDIQELTSGNKRRAGLSIKPLQS